MVRGPFYDKNGVKKGAWSREEDDKLRAYIQRYGHSNWRQLPKSAGLARCGKSCRLRWMNYLRPDLIHGNFSNEEEELIIKLRQKHGNKWSLIAEKLPGRSDNDIKNHWHSHLKKSLKRNDTKPELKSEPSGHTESGRPSHVLVGAGPECHHILESSSALPLSTETSYTQENFSSFTSNSNDAESSMKWSREEDSVVSWELLQELSSDDFWSRPFLVENTTTYNDSVPIFSYLYEGTDLSDLRGILDW